MFKFKKFQVSHEFSSMKVGTDAILLACWANANNKKKALDIGTGCGIIALILAQRFPELTIHAVDIDAASVQESRLNFQNSPWNDRLIVEENCFVNFAKNTNPNTFDLIISNPPFFVNSLKPSRKNKNQARHSENLPFEDLAKGVKKLLSTTGSFACILPNNEAVTFEEIAQKEDLFCYRKTKVITKQGKNPERYLMEFRHEEHPQAENFLQIADEHGNYTKEYLTLVKDFYLFA